MYAFRFNSNLSYWDERPDRRLAPLGRDAAEPGPLNFSILSIYREYQISSFKKEKEKQRENIGLEMVCVYMWLYKFMVLAVGWSTWIYLFFSEMHCISGQFVRAHLKLILTVFFTVVLYVYTRVRATWVYFAHANTHAHSVILWHRSCPVGKLISKSCVY